MPLHRVRLVRLVDPWRQTSTGCVEEDRAKAFEVEPQMQQRRLVIVAVVPGGSHPQQPPADQVGGGQLSLVVAHPSMVAAL
ncbi:hypothetical protein [Streptomyces sp. NPDC051997]|uniref:hypothetical protein n=1 Tax=Streptomyces sp. NPDC051997 TaxID=3155611 RepID=UPI00341EBE59